ncbi:MAG: hypothetical protein HY889_01610 [Deltaproteobacteria bacterium]|nr:hypothetical protein [Deltaproteobacteria bacterium]
MNKACKNPALISLCISLWSLFLFFGPLGCAKSYVPPEDGQDILRAIYEESLLVKENLELVGRNKDAPWAQGDIDFYGLWLKGLEEEKKKRFADAAGFYKKAYKVTRYEVSSYEVLLPLGRAYLLGGEKRKAFYALKEFLKEAESEVSNPRPWELTEEGEQALRRNMVRAKRLLDLCK